MKDTLKWLYQLVSWGGDAQFTWQFVSTWAVKVAAAFGLPALFVSLPFAAVVVLVGFAVVVAVAVLGHYTGYPRWPRLLSVKPRHRRGSNGESIDLALANHVPWDIDRVRIYLERVSLWGDQTPREKGWLVTEAPVAVLGEVDLDAGKTEVIPFVTREDGAGTARIIGSTYPLRNGFKYRIDLSVLPESGESFPVEVFIEADWGAPATKLIIFDGNEYPARARP